MIRILDEETINQIAAGEVIERPASVVKELMENAIDARATSITAEITEGGISFIRITDNGTGMAREDVKTAFLRHATSKIKSAEDLLRVSSLGFRGEALSSIGAVSMSELITKRREDFFGTRYEFDGGKGGEPEEIGVPDGTTFIVRNLFFNTPARKKFLKTAMTEASYINDVVTRMALSRPDIGIRFINSGRHVLHTGGNGKLKDVIYNVYGREIASNLLEVSGESDSIRISGFIGKPLICRGNRSYENYFVNGRYIKSSIINKAIEDGFKNFMMQHKYPFTALHLETKQELLDVNVHPAKLELRFKNAEEVYSLIVKAVSDALKSHELINATALASESEVQAEVKEELKAVNSVKTPEYFETSRIEKLKEQYQSFGEAIKENNKNNENNSTDENIYKSAETSPFTDMLIKEKDNNYNKEAKQLELFDGRLLSEEARLRHNIIGQVFETYWIVEYGEKLFIIDQHAAHEKVLYERTIKRLKERRAISQAIDPPIILSLNMREQQAVKEYMPYFKELGYELEEFGGNEYAVRAVPFDLFSVAKRELLTELIDELADEGGHKKVSKEALLQNDLLLERAASMSCKAAVKGNHRLSFDEARALIDELMTLENPYNCPHGRPTIISVSKYEMEKRFKRIV